MQENVEEAQHRGAVTNKKFWFRKDIFRSDTSTADCIVESDAQVPNNKDEYALMSIDEIINGHGEKFPGLIALLREYLLSVDIDAGTYNKIDKYLDLIAGRASGRYETTAQWIRNFVRSHPDYKQDSVVSELINYDLTKLICEFTTGKVVLKELIGKK